MPCEDTCRALRAADAEAVVALFRQVFDPAWTADTIYAAHGAARWIASLLQFPDLEREHVFVGVQGRDRLAGFMEFRAVGEVWHANHLAVDPAAQGSGLARLLMEGGLAIGLERGFRRQSLDVDPTNVKVAAWHQRNGFRTVAERLVFHERLALHGAASGEVELRGWPVACAAQEIYGFSQFTLHHDGKDYLVGRLAEDRFRVSGPIPPPVRGALARLTPEATLVHIHAADEAPTASAPAYRVHRMERTV